MRIVDRKTFLAMPDGTVYAKYEPQDFGPLCVKGDSLGDIDFYSGDLCHPRFEGDHGSDTHYDILTEIEGGASVAVYLNVEGRDGLFDKGQLFAIWERADVEALIARLQETLR